MLGLDLNSRSETLPGAAQGSIAALHLRMLQVSQFDHDLGLRSIQSLVLPVSVWVSDGFSDLLPAL